jgi:hypothetical protein
MTPTPKGHEQRRRAGLGYRFLPLLLAIIGLFAAGAIAWLSH